MKKQIFLTSANPTQTSSEAWQAATCLVLNPTASAIDVRIGGTDFPSTGSASMYVPALSIYQFPALTNNFGFAFETPTLLGEAPYPITTAIIWLFDAHEPVASIGSIVGTQKVQYYDALRNPKSSALGYANSAGPHAETGRWTYTVPAGRRSMVEVTLCTLYRDAVAAGPNLAYARISVTPLGGAQTFIALATINNGALGALDRSPSPSSYSLGPGDNITALTFDASANGSITYYMSAKYTEFDL